MENIVCKFFILVYFLFIKIYFLVLLRICWYLLMETKRQL